MLGLMPELSGSSHGGCFTAKAYHAVYSMVRVTLSNCDLFSVDKVTCGYWHETSPSCGSKVALLCELQQLHRVACTSAYCFQVQGNIPGKMPCRRDYG